VLARKVLRVAGGKFDGIADCAVIVRINPIHICGWIFALLPTGSGRSPIAGIDSMARANLCGPTMRDSSNADTAAQPAQPISGME
jgi:hypothetical protein